jgi:hypothetical protein
VAEEPDDPFAPAPVAAPPLMVELPLPTVEPLDVPDEPAVVPPLMLPLALPVLLALFSWICPLAFRQCVAAETLPVAAPLALGELLVLELPGELED